MGPTDEEEEEEEEDITPQRENPRNIVHSFFTVFYAVQTCHSR
jgi:hypothetical protein